MITYNGEQYLNATEVAQRFTIPRPTCHNNVLPHMQKCYLPGRKRAFYKQSDVEQFAAIRTEDHRKKISPALPSTVPAGDVVTSSHNIRQSGFGTNHSTLPVPPRQP